MIADPNIQSLKTKYRIKLALVINCYKYNNNISYSVKPRQQRNVKDYVF